MPASQQHHAYANVARVPFQPPVSVDDIVVHPGWAAAWHAVLDALSRPGLIAVLGPSGAGKTLFLQALTRALRQAGWDALLLQHGAGEGAGNPQIVLIDQADRLPGAVLDVLARQARPCVLAGPPALLERFSELPAGLSIVTLGPLAPSDVGPFLAAQLAQSGQPADLLHPDAVAALARHAAGSARAVQTLAGLAVFLARLEDAPQVSAAHVAEAAEVQSGTTLRHEDLDEDAPAAPPEQHGPGAVPAAHQERPASPRRRRTTAAAVTTVCGVVVAGALLSVGLSQPAVTPPAPGSASADARPMSADAPATTNAVAVPGKGRPAQSGPALDSAAPSGLRDSVTQAPDQAGSTLPTSVPVRVMTVYQRSDPAAERRSIELVQKLRAEGFDASDPDPGTPRRGEPMIGFFFAEDAAGAAAVARQAGETGRERLVTQRGGPPRPGTVRVTVSSNDPTFRARRASAPQITSESRE